MMFAYYSHVSKRSEKKVKDNFGSPGEGWELWMIFNDFTAFQTHQMRNFIVFMPHEWV